MDERLHEADSLREPGAGSLAEAVDCGRGPAVPQDAKALQTDLRSIVRTMRVRYPNLRLIYLSSRTYGGYAITGLNPEPAAYDSGYAVRGVIQDRMRRQAARGRGSAGARILDRRPASARSDGLVWKCDDVEDGRDATRRRQACRRSSNHADRPSSRRTPPRGAGSSAAEQSPPNGLCTIAPVKGPVGIVGAGYVGLPLAQVFADGGQRILLVESNPERGGRRQPRRELHQRRRLGRPQRHVESGDPATSDYDALQEAEAILISLPTPLSPQREPDLSFVLGAVEDIAPRLQRGQLVVLESTTYPGTTRERLLPLLEQAAACASGEDFHLAFSPERVDPGREDWTTKTTPKIVGGITPACTERGGRRSTAARSRPSTRSRHPRRRS